MYAGHFVFSQLMAHLPMHTFRRCVARYRGHHKVKAFTCLDQFLCLAFAQLTHRESLRDIEACLRAQHHKLYHMGFRSAVSRNTLANANQTRDWRIYADFAQALIALARPLYADEDLGLELDNTVYALDATTIDLCLSVFPWARFCATKGAIKLHTLLDLKGSIPMFIHISDGTLHDVNVLDLLLPEPGALYVMDRGYLDFKRLHAFHQAAAFFILRAKSNWRYQRLYSHPVDKTTGLRCDQIVRLVGKVVAKRYPDTLRRIKFTDPETGQRLVFLTNHFTLPAYTITQLYRSRWQVELFFKWIKQHLRIKAFYGTSENAVKTQIWTAVSVYVLVAIIKKRLNIPLSLYTILQILSVSVFEKMPLDHILTKSDYNLYQTDDPNQLILFD